MIDTSSSESKLTVHIDGIEYPANIDWTNLKKIQNEQYLTLKQIAKLCDNNGIRYFLEAGTLLGAMRHNGFIPWDDDIDLVLPRPDYNRLLALLRQHSEFIVLDWLTTEDYCYPYAKVMRPGVDNAIMFNISAIDVFPLDGISRSRMIRKVQYYLWLTLQNIIINRKGRMRGLRHYICNFLGLFLPKSEFSVKRLSERLTLSSSKWAANSLIGNVYSEYGEKHYVPFCYYDNGTVRKVKFQDAEYRIPVEAEKYLTRLFGDWKSYPPVSDRAPRHSIDDPWFYSARDILTR